MKNNIFFPKLLIVLCLLSISGLSRAQCPTPHFTISSPVCAGSTLQINNTSTAANSYKWDFSPGYFSQTGVKCADTLLNLSFPGDITSFIENDTMVMFISGWGDNKLHRVTFGNGPGMPPTQVEDLGNLGVFSQPADVAIYSENGTYYGFVVDYSSNYLYRFRLGGSVHGTPDSVTTVLTNITSNLNSPRSIKIEQDSLGNIFGIAGNHGNGTITVLSFGTSILNIPTASAPVATGAGSVKDAVFARTCGNWYAFLACNSGVKRADFGNSPANVPVISSITTTGTPSDIVLVDDSAHWKLLYTDDGSWLMRKYDLGNDMTNTTPAFLGTESFPGMLAPKGICHVRSGQNSFIYLMNESKRLQTIMYSNSTDVNVATSEDFEPAGIVFNSPGVYPVTLYAKDINGN
jgi:hypothetical protein